MEEIPNNHLRCKNPVNNGINYLSTGAGFQPSTVRSLTQQKILIFEERKNRFIHPSIGPGPAGDSYPRKSVNLASPDVSRHLPSLKLTVRTWKWMVGILVSFWDGLFSGAMLVLGSVRAMSCFFKQNAAFYRRSLAMLWVSVVCWVR